MSKGTVAAARYTEYKAGADADGATNPVAAPVANEVQLQGASLITIMLGIMEKPQSVK